MAHAINLHDYAAPASSGLFARVRQVVADYRTYFETLNELDALNDRELADLGIARGNIRAIAYSSVFSR